MPPNMPLGNFNVNAILPDGHGQLLPIGNSAMMENRLKDLRREKGWTQGDLAERAGVDTSYISRLETGKRGKGKGGKSGPTYTVIKSIANALGVNVEELGTTDLLESTGADGVARVQRARSERSEPRRLSEAEEWQEEERELARRSVDRAYSVETWKPRIKGAVPELDGRLGAGEGEHGEILQLDLGGTSISGHKIVDEWLFPEKVLRAEMGASISKTVVMLVKGDSMEPNYRPGDRVLVDLTQKSHDEDTVYVISDGESAPRIKRLVTVFNSKPRKLLVVSDNPAISDQELLATDITIIGRVVGVVSRR